MLYAWICLNVSPGREFVVLDYLKELPGIMEAHVVYGLYDLIAKVEVKQLADLKPLVFGELSHLPFIKTTITMIVK